MSVRAQAAPAPASSRLHAVLQAGQRAAVTSGYLAEYEPSKMEDQQVRDMAPPVYPLRKFEEVTDGAFKVVIAGKGNMAKQPGVPEADMGKYETYMANFPESNSFAQQYIVFQDFMRPGVVEKDFDEIIVRSMKEAKLAGYSNVIFMFDGDNMQQNSPFTLGIAYLISKGYGVYAFKDKVYKFEENPKHGKYLDHVRSWGKYQYTALVNLQETVYKEAADYTQSVADLYFSYGTLPLMKVPQPQKDGEIVYEDVEMEVVRKEVVAVPKDKFGRKLYKDGTPGLIVPSAKGQLDKITRKFGVEAKDLEEMSNKHTLVLLPPRTREQQQTRRDAAALPPPGRPGGLVRDMYNAWERLNQLRDDHGVAWDNGAF